MSASASGSPTPSPGSSSSDSGYVPTTRHDEPPATGGPARVSSPAPRPAAVPHPSAGSAGSAAGSESAAHVSGGKRVELEIRARLDELAQFGVATDSREGFGPKDERPPAYPASGYVLEAPIDAGTYGSVWKAHSGDDEQRTVAIKFFPRRQGSAREINNDTKHLKRLTNENGFVQLLDINTAAEWPYFVMSYAERSLQGEIKEKGPLPVREAVRLFTKLVAAMAHAHAKKPGLCHCDLKPSNVLLSEQRDPLVSDFGQSRLLDDRDRAALGTFFFMPPEQADMGKETPDSRWDVYALGAIFYQMVNPSRLPPRMDGWDRAGSVTASKKLITRLTAYREHLVSAPKPAAHRTAPGMDGRLADVIDRCLDLDPGRRYVDAGAIQEALRRRAAARRRTPVIRLAVVATVLILTVAVGASGMLGRAVVGEQRDQLMSQLKAGQKETAYIAARLLEEKLEQRVSFFERVVPNGPAVGGAAAAAADPDYDEAVKCLKAAADKTKLNNGQQPLLTLWLQEDRLRADRWLKAVADRAAREKVFTHRGLCVIINTNGFGYLFSRTEKPDGREKNWTLDSPWRDQKTATTFSKNFSWRDWFGRSGYQKTEQADGPKASDPVRDTLISVVYPSNTDNRWGIDVSRPMWGTDDSGQPAVVGLLTAGTDVQSELTDWMEKINEKQGQGSGDGPNRQSSLIVVNDRGYLIWHPEFVAALADERPGGDANARAVREQELYGRIQRYVDWRTASKSVDGQEWFFDPWYDSGSGGGGQRRYLATAAEFYPYGRKNRGETPWHVIVTQEAGAALKPVNDLRDTLVLRGLMAGGIFLAVAGALWGGVFWMLRRAEGATDG